VLRPVGSPEDPSVVETTGPKNWMPSSGEGPTELVSVPRTKPLTCVKVKACAGAGRVTESATALTVASSLDIFSPIIANSPLGPAFAQDPLQEPYQATNS